MCRVRKNSAATQLIRILANSATIMPDASDNTLLAPRFLFRFSVPLLRFDGVWKAGGIELGEQYRLLNLAELDANTADRERPFADLRAAWNMQGVLFAASVAGKEQPLWCRDERLD